MKFLLMFYADEKVGVNIPPDEMAGYMAQLAAYRETLQKAGAFVSTEGLYPTTTAKTISNIDGDLQVHDGPYADTREQFGGYFIIQAPDMDEAIRLAAICPAATWGKIEIRTFV